MRQRDRGSGGVDRFWVLGVSEFTGKTQPKSDNSKPHMGTNGDQLVVQLGATVGSYRSGLGAMVVAKGKCISCVKQAWEMQEPNHLLGRLLEPEKGHIVIHRKTLTVQEHLTQVHHRRSMMLLRCLHVM